MLEFLIAGIVIVILFYCGLYVTRFQKKYIRKIVVEKIKQHEYNDDFDRIKSIKEKTMRLEYAEKLYEKYLKHKDNAFIVGKRYESKERYVIFFESDEFRVSLLSKIYKITPLNIYHSLELGWKLQVTLSEREEYLKENREVILEKIKEEL